MPATSRSPTRAELLRALRRARELMLVIGSGYNGASARVKWRLLREAHAIERLLLRARIRL